VDKETIAINLVAGYLVKNELPTVDHVDEVVERLTGFYKATVDELESDDAKRSANRLRRQGRR
jgi:hypothetical protein